MSPDIATADAPVRRRGQSGPAARERAQATALPALTGLRFVAAALVVFHHFGPYVLAPRTSDPWFLLKVIERNVRMTGFVGVDLFFVLSGFILSYSYLDAGGLLGGRRAFWVARAARIYPLYLCAWVIAAWPVTWSHEPHASLGGVGIAALLLQQGWLPGLANLWNPPAWSLSAEAFFYALFPVAGVAITRLNRRHLFAALAILWAISLAPPLLYLAIHPGGAYWQHMDTTPLFHLPTFLIGMATGRLYVLAPAGIPGVPESNARRYLRPGLLAACALAGITAILAVVPWAYGTLYHVALTPLLVLLIYGLAWGRGPLASALSRPAVVLLGEASYGLYILHYPLWEWLAHCLGVPAPDAAARLPVFLAYLGGSVALSVVTLRAIEQPARRAIRRAFTQASPARAIGASHGMRTGRTSGRFVVGHAERRSQYQPDGRYPLNQ